MKIKIIALLTLLSMLLSLVSCDLIAGLGDTEEQIPDVTPELPEEEPIPEHEHVWRAPTCTKPERCDCGESRGEPLGHDMTEPTCTEYAVCLTKGCGYIGDTLAAHTVRYSHNNEGASSLTCTACDAAVILGSSYYLDGTHYDGMVGIANRGVYTTKEGTHLPVLTENGEYQLLNITDQQEQMQLWVPSNVNVLNGFRRKVNV